MANRREMNGVVVMGGGPAGLASAYTLSMAGLPVVVLEKASVLGGLSRTVVRDGFRFDIGGHRWFTKKDELNAFLADLMGPDLLDVRRTSRIIYEGKYFDYPVNLRGIVGGMKASVTARVVVDYLFSRVHAGNGNGSKGHTSMRDAYVAQFGRALYELFFERYSRKVWGYDCDQLSGDWVVQRSRGLSLGTLAKAALIRPNGRAESLVDRFKYPRLGIGQMSERMGYVVETTGGEVLLDSAVREVRNRNGRIEGVAYERSGRLHVIDCSHLVSSIPITELVETLRPSPPGPVLDAARRLTYRDLITVNVMFDRERVTKDTWIYVHDPEIGFGRLHEPGNWSPYMAPRGQTSVVVEYFCSVGDEIWSTSDDVLCEMTVDCIANRLQLASRREVLGAFAVRSRGAYPTYLLGYERDLRTIKAYLRSLSGLQIIGRSGTFRYNNMDHSVETGILAARNILGEVYDIDAVNSEKEYHESKMEL